MPKDLPVSYAEREEAESRKPIELYVILSMGMTWYVTSHGKPVTYLGEVYTPAPISRGGIDHETELKPATMDITISATTTTVLEMLVQGPLEPVSIWVIRIFADQDPVEGVIIFGGKIIGTSVLGLALKATVTNRVNLFNKKFPRFKYQVNCNHFLFSQPNDYHKWACGLDKEDWGVNAEVSMITNEGFTLRFQNLLALDVSYDDGWFNGGMVKWGNQWRMIISHEGIEIRLFYPFYTLPEGNPFEIGAAVTLYPGCDGSAGTCFRKFQNFSNFLGFPNIPISNPVITDLSLLG